MMTDEEGAARGGRGIGGASADIEGAHRFAATKACLPDIAIPFFDIHCLAFALEHCALPPLQWTDAMLAGGRSAMLQEFAAATSQFAAATSQAAAPLLPPMPSASATPKLGGVPPAGM